MNVAIMPSQLHLPCALKGVLLPILNSWLLSKKMNACFDALKWMKLCAHVLMSRRLVAVVANPLKDLLIKTPKISRKYQKLEKTQKSRKL